MVKCVLHYDRIHRSSSRIFSCLFNSYVCSWFLVFDSWEFICRGTDQRRIKALLLSVHGQIWLTAALVLDGKFIEIAGWNRFVQPRNWPYETMWRFVLIGVKTWTDDATLAKRKETWRKRMLAAYLNREFHSPVCPKHKLLMNDKTKPCLLLLVNSNKSSNKAWKT